jgi:large subunit ribosomal protein L19
MKHPELANFEKKYVRAKPLPNFRAGDSLTVWVKIAEGKEKDGSTKFRLQAFEGTCIRARGGSTSETFMVRKISAGGIGVDRNFFANSPLIDRVEVKMRGRVRKSRVYYLRRLKGKAARISGRVTGAEG